MPLGGAVAGQITDLSALLSHRACEIWESSRDNVSINGATIMISPGGYRKEAQRGEINLVESREAPLTPQRPALRLGGQASAWEGSPGRFL